MRHSNLPNTFICIYFPEWSVDVTRRQLSDLKPPLNPEAILLTTNKSNQTEIVRACRNSLSAGVRPGMSLALAKALTPTNTYDQSFDPLRDLRALQTLAAWCLRFTPSVGLDRELRNAHARDQLDRLDPRFWGIILDMTGTQRLHRDLSQLANRLHTAFKERAKIALAPTISGAWALSRYRLQSPTVAPSYEALNTLIAELPVAALRIDRDCSENLNELGINTVSELLKLPRHTLAQRFGKNILFRLAQLSGGVEERVYPITPIERYYKQKIFEPPLHNRRSITTAIESIFNTLINDLKQARVAAKLFKLSVSDTSSKTTEKHLPLASATNDSGHLSAIIQPIIDSISFCGEVRMISIEAQEVVYTTPIQTSFYTQHSPQSEAIERAYTELLNSFSVRIGKDRVLRARLTQSHIPERAFSYSSAIESYQTSPPIPSYAPSERPTILFSQPEPISTIALLPDKPPSWIRWRSTNLPVTIGVGPERIAPEWWRGEIGKRLFAERDYFKVQDGAGRWLWVYRDQTTQTWFVHGVWT